MKPVFTGKSSKLSAKQCVVLLLDAVSLRFSAAGQ
jgi:hypothetical protein